MAKFRRRPIVIDAIQWFKLGDHPSVKPYAGQLGAVSGAGPYGWVPTLEGGHIVTPGDWIITGVQGELYPCKPDIFAATYEPAQERV
jgi:hypothetical protein